jgi:5-methyltetrahydrofolate--homocysteine methyltransferase
VNLVAIPSAYLGCPYKLVAGSNSAWAEPIISDWQNVPTFAFNPENEWWQISKKLLEALASRAQGKYYIGVPDLNGPGEILALLRGTQPLIYDLTEQEPEVFRSVIDQVNFAWLRYWQASIGIIHQWVDGYMYWMGIWSDRPSIDLQNDFSCMISPKMFNEIFLPSLEQQTQWVERTIYHLDGPGAIRHLDALLSLPRLTGIQWVPGAGSPPMSKWLPLLRRIQTKGKLLALNCEPWEVETLLTGLEPEGLLLSTSCSSEEEAKDLLKKANRWSVKRTWLLN